MANDWVTSREAARRLGISAATLYAYVSRGLLRSEAVDGSRERRYRADDISRLKRRREVGRKAESIANHALDFGTPVLESALTLIEDGHLYYRGVDATGLARTASLEDVARLLWECDDKPFAVDNLPPLTTALRRAWLAAATLGPVDRCLVLLPAAAALDHPSWVEDRAAMLETGVRVLRLLTAAVTARPPSTLPVHQQLATAWRVPPEHAPLLRAALVLSADHEFNASAFAARVVASTGANLYGAVMAGLAALNGPRHGGLTRRVASLFDDLKTVRPGRHPVRPVARISAAIARTRLRRAARRRGRAAARPQGQCRFHHRDGRTRARPAEGFRPGAVPAGSHRGLDRSCPGAGSARCADPSPCALHRTAPEHMSGRHRLSTKSPPCGRHTSVLNVAL